MIEFALWGLGGSIVTGLVLELVKRVWVDAAGQPVIQDRLAVVAAVAIGIVLSIAAYLGSVYPVVATWLDVIGAGAMAGLVACGLYSLVKTRP